MAFVEDESPPPSDTALARTWKFSRRMIEPVVTEVRVKRAVLSSSASVCQLCTVLQAGSTVGSLETTQMELRGDRTAFLGKSSETGVWNLVPEKRMLEMEFELNEDESTYLLYQAKLGKGRYYRSSVRFEEDGKIFLVKGLPLPWNKKLVGNFRVSPTATPVPTVSMKVS
eukprot:CAMPEP_0171655474 /NCGR_PEP_ID=MMETSP0990-20121206/40914_1 /TAXON_ID=483369 /ORGANISM="non described non described, Strain CCMP2098" /LENGTH=169 /DNA_ID=CAMNT_0012235577 /DNA_START=53 /DNA_END=562 /DNA_ORIENTATION=+